MPCRGLSGVVSRVDYILIATATVEGHVNLLKQVLEQLQFHNLRVCKDKCKFLRPSIMYLGHTLSGAGLAPDLDKVKDLKDTRPPTNVSKVHSFCGFVRLLREFLARLFYSITAAVQFDKKWCKISMG